MDFITANGIDWVLAIRSLGAWLELPMRFFSLLGDENFFFMVLPLLYWSVDSRLGLRVAFILITSNFLSSFMKLLFAAPRPYWISTEVNPLASETNFGIPSGHAQNAVALWGIMAAGIRRRWAWAAAFSLAFLIGFSRVYLGLHFVEDVIAGWLIGALLLFTFMTLWNPVGAWLASQSPVSQVAIALTASLIVIGLGMWQVTRLDGYVLPQEWIDNALRAGAAPDPVSMDGFLTSAGTLFGLAAGLAWIHSRGGYQTDGPLMTRILRYVIGLIGILILWRGLGVVFPRDDNLISYLLRYFRYALVGFWISAAAPWLFFHFKLSGKPKM
jgi:membrane-associated phospholipid phosphatase